MSAPGSKRDKERTEEPSGSRDEEEINRHKILLYTTNNAILGKRNKSKERRGFSTNEESAERE
jgi:hypothetical protein